MKTVRKTIFRTERCATSSSAERLAAAAAAARRVRVLDREAGAAHVLDEVHGGAVELQRALGVDDDLDVAHGEDVVGRALLVEREAVLKSRAAAALDEDAQGLARGVRHFRGEILDLIDGTVGDVEDEYGRRRGLCGRGLGDAGHGYPPAARRRSSRTNLGVRRD